MYYMAGEGEGSDSEREVMYFLTETGQVRSIEAGRTGEVPGKLVRLAGRQKGLTTVRKGGVDISSLEKRYAPLFAWAGTAESPCPSESLSEEEVESPVIQVAASTPIRRQRTRKMSQMKPPSTLFEPPPSCLKLREFLHSKPTPPKPRPRCSITPTKTLPVLPLPSKIKRSEVLRSERLERGTVSSRRKEVTPTACPQPHDPLSFTSRKQQVTRVIRRLGTSTLARSISVNSKSRKGLLKVHQQIHAYLLN